MRRKWPVTREIQTSRESWTARSAMLRPPARPKIIYAKARSNAALGNYLETMDLLKRAVSLDSKTIREWAKKEKIFEKLHDNEQFRKLVKL